MRHTLYIINVYIHILSAMMWIGGILFMVFVIVPILRKLEVKSQAPTHQKSNQKESGQAAMIVHKVGVQFRLVGWIALLLLLVTGILNLGFRGYHWADFFNGNLWQGDFGHNLAIKLACVTVIYLISAFHDFYIGPKATELWQQKPDDPEVKKLRRQAGLIGRLNLVLGLVVVFEAVMMVRGAIF